MSLEEKNTTDVTVQPLTALEPLVMPSRPRKTNCQAHTVHPQWFWIHFDTVNRQRQLNTLNLTHTRLAANLRQVSGFRCRLVAPNTAHAHAHRYIPAFFKLQFLVGLVAIGALFTGIAQRNSLFSWTRQTRQALSGTAFTISPCRLKQVVDHGIHGQSGVTEKKVSKSQYINIYVNCLENTRPSVCGK